MRAVREPRIVRPVGRPTVEQLATTATLFSSAKNFQQWQIDNKKIATGKSVNSWVVTLTKHDNNQITEGNLTGASYIFYDLFGRGPGKQPPIADIIEWMRAKPIRARRGSTRIRSAYLIARAIGERGTIAPKMPQSLPTTIVQTNTRTVTRKAAPLFADQEAQKFFKIVQTSFNAADAEANVVVTSSRPSTRSYTLKDLLP
jgi:hypothetical protein